MLLWLWAMASLALWGSYPAARRHTGMSAGVAALFRFLGVPQSSINPTGCSAEARLFDYELCNVYESGTYEYDPNSKSGNLKYPK